MKSISRVVLLLTLTACGEPPEHIDGRRSGGPALNSSRELPPGHPPTAGEATTDESFAGNVLLKGTLATREEGYVFVSVRARGGRTPVLSKKLSIAGAPVADGVRTVAFTLDQRDNFMGMPLPEAVELHAMFSKTPFVDSKEVEAAVPTENDATGIEVVLSLE